MFKIFFALLLFTTPIYAQSIIDVPILKDNTDNQSNNSFLNNYQNAMQSFESPASTNVNSEIISSQSKNSTQLRSLNELTDKIKSGLIQHYGGENGITEIHLRGARAFSPTFYFNGMPLTSAVQGENNFNLLPLSSIGELYVYPDNAPFWMSTMGIGGDINVHSCNPILCSNLENNANTKFNFSSQIGSYGFHKIAISNSNKITKQSNSFESADFTNSKENYPIFNNHNSSIHPDQGQYEIIQNNDFTHGGFYGELSSYINPLGKLSLNIAYGFKNQGLPEKLDSEPTQSRVLSHLLVSTFRLEKLFPQNGFQWINQLGFLWNGIQVTSNRPVFSNQNTKSQMNTFQYKSYFIFPLDFKYQKDFGASVELLKTNSLIQTKQISLSKEIESNKSAQRFEIRPSLFESVGTNIGNNLNIQLQGQTWVSFANDDNKQYQKYIYGYTLGVQGQISLFIPYFRYLVSQRRPYFLELYGSPSGIISNLNLNNEMSQKSEIGIRIPNGEVGIYYGKDENLIFLEQLNAYEAQYLNLEDGNRKGLFLNLNYNVAQNLLVEFSYQYLNSKMIKDNLEFQVPRSPRHTVKLNLKINPMEIFKIWNHKIKIGGNLNSQYETPFYLDMNNLNILKTNPILNAGIQFLIANNTSQFSIAIEFINITNENFSSLYNSTGYNIQENSNGYLNIAPPGRRFYISFSGDF